MYSYNERVLYQINLRNSSSRTISQIYLIKYSTCFGEVHCPSSGLSQHFIHSVVICHASSVECLIAWSISDHASR